MSRPLSREKSQRNRVSYHLQTFSQSHHPNISIVSALCKSPHKQHPALLSPLRQMNDQLVRQIEERLRTRNILIENPMPTSHEDLARLTNRLLDHALIARTLEIHQEGPGTLFVARLDCVQLNVHIDVASAIGTRTRLGVGGGGSGVRHAGGGGGGRAERTTSGAAATVIGSICEVETGVVG